MGCSNPTRQLSEGRKAMTEKLLGQEYVLRQPGSAHALAAAAIAAARAFAGGGGHCVRTASVYDFLNVML